MPDPYFLFMAPDWTPASAGVRVVHQLCHEVRSRGARAYLVPCVKNPDLDTELWSEKVSGTAIAVYPEGIHGNPLGANVVARWLLHFQPHNFVDLKHDLFFAWQPQYARSDALCHSLRIPTLDYGSFYPPAGESPRTLKCYAARKYRAKGYEVPEDIQKSHIDVDSIASGDKVALRKLFHRCSEILLFENTTTGDEAALCGCQIAVAKNLPWTVEATSFEEFERIEQDMSRSVDRFIELCMERAG